MMTEPFTTRPEINGTFGVATSTHWLASAAGMAILEKGGNAFDAAVAMGFALQVVEPHLNGPGGEVPMIIHDASVPQGPGGIEVICGQGVAPAGATMEHYQDLGLTLIPGSGLLATVVPGAFDAWMLLLRDHGTLYPRDVLAHAIDYAGGGCILVPLVVATIERVETLFRKEWPTSAACYLPAGAVPKSTQLFRNDVLARTYQRLLAEGEAAGGNREAQIEAMRRAWSQGFVADAIDRFCRSETLMDSSGRRHPGVLTGDDMARWKATKEMPVQYDYHGITVCKNGPWSQGPAFLQQLALIAGDDISALDPLGPAFVHLVTEAAKLALADRDVFYGDPHFVDVPLEQLLSAEYNAERRRAITEAASHDHRPGEIPGYGGRHMIGEADPDADNDIFDAIGAGEPTVQSDGVTRGDTCHLDVIDRAGNMISATPSGGWLQSSPTIPELGFCLNSRAQMFWLEPGHPAALAPGKRPRSTLSVNLAIKEGKPWMVFGTPGGDYQDQWTLTFFLHKLHHDMNLQEAIDTPLFHTDHMASSFWPRTAEPGSLSLESRFPKATVKALREQGHKVAVVEPWSLGRLSAATKEGPVLRAAANPRFMQGYAIGR